MGVQNRQNLFYIIKFIRFKKGIEIFDVAQVMDYVKHRQMRRMQKYVENNDQRANDRFSDNTHIGDILLLSYALKTAR